MQPSLNGSTQRGTSSSLSPNQADAAHQAAAALWLEHRRWIAAVLLSYKPRHVDVEDLLQEVAMTLVAKINTLRDQANVRAWLRVVAVNVARAAGRSERSKPSLRIAPDELDRSIPAAEETQAPQEHHQRILNMAQQLPDIYREPLLLKAVHGLRTRQISTILGIPEATVDTRVSRARRMLRDQVQNLDFYAEPSPAMTNSKVG